MRKRQRKKNAKREQRRCIKAFFDGMEAEVRLRHATLATMAKHFPEVLRLAGRLT